MTNLKAKYIGANSVVNAKLVQVSNKTFKGRLSPGSGNVEDISLRDLTLKHLHNFHITENDFETSVYHPWSTTSSMGAVNLQVAPPDTGSCGVIESSTGTGSNNGYAGINYRSSAISLFTGSGGVLISISKIRLPVLSVAEQGFDIRVGFGDSISPTDHTDSCGYFKYSHNTNGGNWVISTANNATRTKTNTTVAPVANQWIYLKTVTNSSGTQTDFYIDNVLVGSITTNIPTTVARAFDYSCFILKHAGFTTRSMLTDRCVMIRERLDVDSF